MDLMEKIVSLCKRRGFVYPGSEIYGGFSGFWDYGPLGVELKNNVKREWWKRMVYNRDDVVGIDTAIIMNPGVWEASGHMTAFVDPLVECKKCHKRYRQDLMENIWKHIPRSGPKVGVLGLSAEEKAALICDAGGSHEPGKFTEPKMFNLLTEVYLGSTEPKQKAYLRGEITQGVFVNFKNIVDSSRVKIPFGIAQIGKAFRNEITPGNFTFRSREFEQMELEYFIKPDKEESKKTFEYWKKERLDWYVSLGMSKNKLRFKEHEPEKRAHYARFAEDIEYEAPFGWSEFEGIHHRGDWDLSQQMKYSNKDLSYQDEESGERFIPWVIETSGGIDRSALFFLINAYYEEKDRIILKFHPKLAPYKVAVFPLLANKPKLVKLARAVFDKLRLSFHSTWDDRGNIGKRYYSQDEIGTPWCVTVDFQSLEDKTITVRDRDTTKQERISFDKLKEYIDNKLKL